MVRSAMRVVVPLAVFMSGSAYALAPASQPVTPPQQPPNQQQAMVSDALGNIAPERFVASPGNLEFTGELLVKLRDDLPRARNGRAFSQAQLAANRLLPQVVDFAPEINEYQVRVPQGMNENTYAEQLLATGDYEYAQPNWTVYALGSENVPNDPNFGISWQHGAVESAKAWAVETGSAEAIVAIVDSGVDLDHPDLQNLLVPGYYSVDQIAQADGGNVDDTNGHGTFCAGCAAAEGNNGNQVVGMGWNMRIMPIKATVGNSGSTQLSSLLRGARWAAENGATVVNVSFSGVGGPAIGVTGTYCADNGALMFWAAGNDNRILGGFEHEDTVVVGASDINDNRAGFSNFGIPVDVFAPGAGVRATFVGGGQGTSSGTSFATPIAAGVAAMIWSANPEIRPRELKQLLEQSSDDIGAPGEDDVFGFGRVNLFNAVSQGVAFCPTLGATSDNPLIALCEGENASFAVETDALLPTFQWLRNGVAIEGETGPTIDLSNIKFDDSGVYSVRIETGCREMIVTAGELDVAPPSELFEQPADIAAVIGQDIQIVLDAELGDGAFVVWERDGAFIAGTSGGTLSITNADASDAGEYTASVLNNCVDGFTTDPIAVSVVPDCAADLNLDGVSNATDFMAWLDCFNGAPGDCDRADVNGDGRTDPRDFTAWLQAVNSGCN